MALKKEVINDKYEIVTEYKQIQVREATVISEGTASSGYTEISRSFNRRVLTPDMDVSSENAEIQALASALWTDEVKQAWADQMVSVEAEMAEPEPEPEVEPEVVEPEGEA